MKYLKGTLDLKLVYGGKEQKFEGAIVVGYSDASYAGDKSDRKSTTGFIFKVVHLFHGAQKNNQQEQIHHEYVALHSTMQEFLRFQKLLMVLGFPAGTVKIYEDNQSAIRVASATGNMRRLKHMDVKYHSVSERVDMKHVAVEYIPREEQLADEFTKLLTLPVFLLIVYFKFERFIIFVYILTFKGVC